MAKLSAKEVKIGQEIKLERKWRKVLAVKAYSKRFVEYKLNGYRPDNNYANNVKVFSNMEMMEVK